MFKATLTDVEVRFAKSSHSRQRLWKQFMEFMNSVNLTEAFQAIEIGGSFLTAKTDPSDIDIALELRLVETPIESALALLTNDQINHIKSQPSHRI